MPLRCRLLILLFYNSDETETFLINKKLTYMIISTERIYGEALYAVFDFQLHETSLLLSFSRKFGKKIVPFFSRNFGNKPHTMHAEAMTCNKILARENWNINE